MAQLKDLEFLMVHLTAKEVWHNTWHQKRQMRMKETISIVKLGMRKKHYLISHKHHPYSNYETDESICQSSSMLRTWHNILEVSRYMSILTINDLYHVLNKRQGRSTL